MPSEKCELRIVLVRYAVWPMPMALLSRDLSVPQEAESNRAPRQTKPADPPPPTKAAYEAISIWPSWRRVRRAQLQRPPSRTDQIRRVAAKTSIRPREILQETRMYPFPSFRNLTRPKGLPGPPFRLRRLRRSRAYQIPQTPAHVALHCDEGSSNKTALLAVSLRRLPWPDRDRGARRTPCSFE